MSYVSFATSIFSLRLLLIDEIKLVSFCVCWCSVGTASSGSGLFHVDVIVLDEVHYLSDISRGTVWEEIVSIFDFWNSFISGFLIVNVVFTKLWNIFRWFIVRKSPTYMSVSDSCKSRWASWLDQSGSVPCHIISYFIWSSLILVQMFENGYNEC